MLQEDALEINFTHDIDVVFLFNPFDSELLKPFLDSLVQTCIFKYVVVVNPIRSYIYEQKGFEVIKTFKHKNESFSAQIMVRI